MGSTLSINLCCGMNGNGGGGTPTPPSPDNFSYNIIATGETITVPEYQQMVVCETIDILGDLILNGDLCIIE